MSRGIEVVFTNEKDRFVRLAKEKLPSIAIVDLASTEYDAFGCCQALEDHDEVIVYCLYPDNRKDLLDEAYGAGFDTSSEYSHLAERLLETLDARYDPEHMLYKLRKWLEK